MSIFLQKIYKKTLNKKQKDIDLRILKTGNSFVKSKSDFKNEENIEKM